MHKNICAFFVLVLPVCWGQQSPPELFFSEMLPSITAENNKIIKERRTLDAWSKLYPLKPTAYILKLQEKYQLTSCTITEKKCIQQLRERVDIIPPSLALAQSALESGFGTSRFAKEGHAYYGQWCFKRGCGIQPLHPNKSLGYYAVKRFSSIEKATEEYIHNLNTQPAYESFRSLRAKQRAHSLRLDSLSLTETLTRYSTTGRRYILDIQSIIKSYELQKYDNLKHFAQITPVHYFL